MPENLVENCGNCDWHFPSMPNGARWLLLKYVWCAAWDEHKRRGYKCKRWSDEQAICLIEPPPWCDNKKEYVK